MGLIVSSSPHIRTRKSTSNIMRDVIIALVPALIAGCIYFGPRALLVTVIAIITSVIFECFSRRIFKKDSSIGDLSAIVTGLLLALNLPPSIPLWMVALGSFVSIVIVKQMFGGLGQNFVNPALFARIVLLISFPKQMTTWTEPLAWLKGADNIDAISQATPLQIIDAISQATSKEVIASKTSEMPSLLDLFIGNIGGSIGETCTLALLIGGIYLIMRKVISPVIPLTYLSTVSVISMIVGQDVLYQLLTGGLVLGAFFMATDYVTSPITTKGRFVFAIGCGLITSIIRFYGSLPEGTSYAIIIMNILVPHIDKLTRTKPFDKVQTIN